MMLHGLLDEIMPAYRQLFTRFGVTEQQWRVLRVLWEAGALSSIEISRKTLLAQNSLVGVLERLEKKRLIQRMRSVEDRRHVFATLTSSGKALGCQVMPELAKIHDNIDSRLTAEEWRQFTYLMNRLGQPDAASPYAEDTSDTPLIQETSHG